MRAWLAGVVRRQAANANRADQRRLRREHAAARPESSLAVDQVLEREALRKSVVDAVLALEEPYRTTILLRFFEELPPRMVAVRMRTPLETVRTRIKRGLAQLRSRLEEAHGSGEQGWRAALLPLGGAGALEQPAPDPPLLTPLLEGVLLVSTTVRSLAALLLVAVFGMGIWAIATQGAEPGGAGPEDGVAAVATESLAETRPVPIGFRSQSREPVAVPAPPSPTDMLALTGRVLAEADVPVLGASVEVRKKPAAGFWINDREYSRVRETVSECATDGDGEFSFRLPRARPFELHVRAAGFATEVVTACYAGQDVTIRMQRGAVLEGRVAAAGTGVPVVGATLQGRREPDKVEILRGVSGPDGRFSFHDLSACALTLEVEPPEGMTPPWQSLTLLPGQVVRHEVEIEHGGTVKGKVTDARTGLPVAGAEVSQGWTFRRVVRTDPLGEYLMRGFPGPGVYDLHVRAAGYGRQGKVVGEPAPGEKVVDFELVPAASARGRILDAAGSPMAGVYVAAAACEATPFSQKTDWQSARTRPDGAFLVENLRTDVRHALFVRHEGFGTVAYDFPAPARSSEIVELGEVTLLPAGCLEGRLVDQGGRGLPATRVELIGTNSDRQRLLGVPFHRHPTNPRLAGAGDPFVSSRTGTTDTEGRFRFADLAEGEYALMVSVHGLPEVTKPGIQVRPGQVVGDVILVMDLHLSVSGRVVTPSGELPGEPGRIVVRLDPERAPGPPRPRSPGDSESSRSELAGPGGEFEFKGVKPGMYVVTARPILSEGEPKWVEGRLRGVTAGSQGLEIPLKRIAWVEGTVVDVSGSPAAGALVAASIQEDAARASHSAQMQCGTDGRFRLLVGEGDVLTIVAGPARPLRSPFGDIVPFRNPRRSASISDVRAGSKDVVIRLP
jgi:protocatechuate 3,4-dioxygenase beta subunit